MQWFSQKVRVTLIDDATDVAIATTDMFPTDLPESFDIETTLQIGDADWFVIHAEPQTREQYSKSGALTLRLRQVEMVATDTIQFSQLDMTERYDDNFRLGEDEWIVTTPMNSMIPNPESSGLPSPGADSEEVYRVASKLSELRESVPIPDDGVYCPICHIANPDLGRLRTPCPQCGRALLKFGWT
jgi:hypothetical protein